jgi:alpha-tubulin suppressor-like RCC1 family protein
MSGYLWKFYLEDDVDSFRQVLETATFTTRTGTHKAHGGGQVGSHNVGLGIGSPGGFATSPPSAVKGRKEHNASRATGNAVSVGLTLTRADINHRDSFGRTLLHLAASSSADTAFEFASALLDHPLTDVYLQESENGWTALHRAFYYGNIAIAQSILGRDIQDALGHGSGTLHHHAGGLIKMKDKEGNGPFDLLEMSLDSETLERQSKVHDGQDADSDDDSMSEVSADDIRTHTVVSQTNLRGDEVYTFGSNKNVTLGFGDEDDRQFPERVTLRRPDHLYFRFYREYLENRARGQSSESSVGDATPTQLSSVAELPAIIRNKPIIIKNMHMSKLHTAVLTDDPESNLYVCGHGPGGRLGVGDEMTRYQFVCIEGGALSKKKLVSVALGQNHTLALSDNGGLFTWGSNGFGQLGYDLPKASGRNEEPVQTLPRQIFGPLKRERIIGVAASRIHSVAHTLSSLFTFGKNEGQLGLVDSDARSLAIQDVPRRVGAAAFSAPISSVSAIDRATTCLLENGEVWVFANFGYARLTFPLDGFTNYFLRASFRTTKYESAPNSISKVVSSGDTICALSSGGEVFTVAVSQPSATAQNKSTTNPSKIKGALSQPMRVWSNKKSHMAARDVDVDQNGAIILATEAGSVWRRVRRAKIKDATASGTGEYKPKDYKFSRISGLTRVTAVRASGFGAYAAVREDFKKTRTDIQVSASTLWSDLWPLAPFQTPGSNESTSTPRDLITLVLKSEDPDEDINTVLKPSDAPVLPYDLFICSTTSDIKIPLHQFIFTARSRVIRQALDELNEAKFTTIPDLLTCHRNDKGEISIVFQGLDILTTFNLVLYLYTDSLATVWQSRFSNSRMNFRHRQTRGELLKVASRLELNILESSLKRVDSVGLALDQDMELAFRDPAFFDNGDVVVRLADDAEAWVHGALICQRCPFFEGLFKGRTGGQWLASRRQQLENRDDAIRVDLTHVESSVFQKVLRYIYADTGAELFDDVVADDVDAFLDVVIDVLGVANELMLDRLSEICQKVVGQYGEPALSNRKTLLTPVSHCSKRLPTNECYCSKLRQHFQGQVLRVHMLQLGSCLTAWVRETVLSWLF